MTKPAGQAGKNRRKAGIPEQAGTRVKGVVHVVRQALPREARREGERLPDDCKPLRLVAGLVAWHCQPVPLCRRAMRDKEE